MFQHARPATNEVYPSSAASLAQGIAPASIEPSTRRHCIDAKSNAAIHSRRPPSQVWRRTGATPVERCDDAAYVTQRIARDDSTGEHLRWYPQDVVFQVSSPGRRNSNQQRRGTEYNVWGRNQDVATSVSERLQVMQSLGEEIAAAVCFQNDYDGLATKVWGTSHCQEHRQRGTPRIGMRPTYT